MPAETFDNSPSYPETAGDNLEMNSKPAGTTFEDLANAAKAYEANPNSLPESGVPTETAAGETAAEAPVDVARHIEAEMTNGEEAEEDTEAEDTEESDESEETEEAENTEEAETETRELSRAEQQLATIEERLKNIEKDIDDTKEKKDKLEEEITAYEETLSENLEKHNELSDKLSELKLEIQRTKRSIISGFANGLKIAKNLVLGKHEEARQLITEIGENLTKNEEAIKGRDETEQALEANETEKTKLDNGLANTTDERNSCASKIARLERQKAEATKQIEMLKEQIANEAWTEAWGDAQEGIKNEMGTSNMAAFRKELADQQKELDDNFDADLAELDTYRTPSRVQQLMMTDEQLAQSATRADEVEAQLTQEHEAASNAIDAKREKVDQYFPTWQKRVSDIVENKLVSGALHTFGRKILMKMRGL